MPDTLLSRIEPKANCFRFYRLSIEPNLFGDHSLVIHWGRLGTHGSFRIECSGEHQKVALRAERLERQKVRRGYCHMPEPGMHRGKIKAGTP